MSDGLKAMVKLEARERDGEWRRINNRTEFFASDFHVEVKRNPEYFPWWSAILHPFRYLDYRRWVKNIGPTIAEKAKKDAAKYFNELKYGNPNGTPDEKIPGLERLLLHGSSVFDIKGSA